MSGFNQVLLIKLRFIQIKKCQEVIKKGISPEMKKKTVKLKFSINIRQKKKFNQATTNMWYAKIKMNNCKIRSKKKKKKINKKKREETTEDIIQSIWNKDNHKVLKLVKSQLRINQVQTQFTNSSLLQPQTKVRYNFIIVYLQQLQKQVESIQSRIRDIEKNPEKAKRRRSPMTEKALNKVIKLFQLFEKCQNSQLDKNRRISMRGIADRLGYCYSTIYELYKDYQFDRTLAQRFTRLKRNRHKGLNKDIWQRRIQSIKSILQENPFRTQGEVAIIMNRDESLKNNGRQIKTKVVSKLLKVMKFSKKKIVKIPKFRNTSQNIQRRFHYCLQYKKLIEANKKVYFLDESAFNLFTIRDMAWSKKGQLVQHKIQFPKGKNVSLIAIISINGIIAWEVKNGNFHKEHHLAFIEKFIDKMSIPQKKQKEYLIMDNCRIHDQTKTNEITKSNQIIEIISLPPYSPQLNPIENWFHQLKSRVRKSVFENQDQLIRQIKKSIEFYIQYDFSHYFRNSMSHVEKGLLRENF